LERAIISILSRHTPAPVRSICIAMLGDMIHGALQHSAEADQLSTLLAQTYGASHAVAQFLRNLSRLAPLKIWCVAGNHGRWPGQKKMPTTNRYSNLDTFFYLLTEALTRQFPNVEWRVDAQPFARFQVARHTCLASHGEHLQGGDFQLGLPAHAIGRFVHAQAQWAFRFGSPVPDYYLVGHLHRAAIIPITRGEILMNGGFPGVDGFGLMRSLNLTEPCQTFCLLHPEHGRTATYHIRLDADKRGGNSYKIPNVFELA